MTSALAAGLALIAATTCAAVLLTAPAASVPSVTLIARPETSTASGAFAPEPATSCAVRPLPPSWPQAFEVSTTALGASAATRLPVWLVNGTSAVAVPAQPPRTVCALR